MENGPSRPWLSRLMLNRERTNEGPAPRVCSSCGSLWPPRHGGFEPCSELPPEMLGSGWETAGAVGAQVSRGL